MQKYNHRKIEKKWPAFAESYGGQAEKYEKI